MAAPTDSARQGTNISTAGTSHAINVGSPVAGTLLIVLVRFAAAPGTVTFTGYTQRASDTSDATDDQTMVFYRDADGTEGATDTLSTANSVKLAAICWEITGAETASRSAPTISTVAVGTTAANGANATSASVTGGPLDTLYITMMGLDGEGNAPSAAPTNYTNLITANSGTGGAVATNCSIGGGSRQITASSSEDAGNFTHAGATTGWTAFTVAIHEPGLFATDAARATTDTVVGTATPAFNTPSGIVAGQLLLLAWRSSGAVDAITDAAGFTQLVLSSADATDDDFYVGYKVADGTEGATITQTVTTSRAFAAIMWRVEDGATPTIGTVGTGSGTSVDPATYNPGVGVINGLWIPIGTCEDSRTVTTFPSPYVNTVEQNTTTTGFSGASIMGGSRQVQSDQVNPNPFSINTTSNGHMHATLAITYEADPAVSAFVPKVVML